MTEDLALEELALDLNAHNEFRAQHVALQDAARVLDCNGLEGDIVRGFATKYAGYREALEEAMAILDEIKDGMEAKVKDIEYGQPDENDEHRLGEQLMGIR